MTTKSGMLLTAQEQLKRWEERFFEIFNKDDNKVRSKQDIRNVEEDNSENETEVNLDPPTRVEMELGLSQLKNGKAADLDNINPEVLKLILK